MNTLHWIFLAYTLGRIFLYWFPISFLLHTFLLPTSFLTLSCFFSPAFLLSSYFQCHIFSYLITFILYPLHSYYPPYSSLYFSFLFLPADYCGFAADMEKGADAQTLSAKKIWNLWKFLDCGKFICLLWNKTLQIVKISSKTSNIWHIFNIWEMISTIFQLACGNFDKCTCKNFNC